MYAISIKQPWAELIITAKKTIEIRSWSTDYRGDLWLHTGKSANDAAVRYYLSQKLIGKEELFTGGYIGIIHLISIVPIDKERWFQWESQHLDFGDFRPNLYGWIFSVTKKFDRGIKGNGKVSLFTPDEQSLVELKKYL